MTNKILIDRAALTEQPAEQESVQDEYNRVINHAIEQGIEASVFLRCWQEGDWSGCAEFGFEPNMAAYTAPQPAKPAEQEPVGEVAEVAQGYDEGWTAIIETGLRKLQKGDKVYTAPQPANARRMVACWNACEGVPTEMLEKAPLDTVLKETVAQRDELLAALREMLAIVNDSRGVAGYHLNGNLAEWDEFDEVDAARAIIAAYEQKNGIGGRSEINRAAVQHHRPVDSGGAEMTPDHIPEVGKMMPTLELADLLEQNALMPLDDVAAAELRRLHAQAAQDEALLRQALETLLGQRGEPDWHTGKQRENAIAALKERLK